MGGLYSGLGFLSLWISTLHAVWIIFLSEFLWDLLGSRSCLDSFGICLAHSIRRCSGHWWRDDLYRNAGEWSRRVSRYGIFLYGYLSLSYSINGYLGIPYAQPPVGNLRFRRPVPVTPSPTVDAQNYGPRCLQSTVTNDASEDCLTLSIWRPQGVPGPLPVMLWICESRSVRLCGRI